MIRKNGSRMIMAGGVLAAGLLFMGGAAPQKKVLDDGKAGRGAALVRRIAEPPVQV